MNPNDSLIPSDTLYRWVSDQILEQLRKFSEYDRPSAAYSNSAYDLVIGSCHYPLEEELSEIFDGLGADDETNRDLGWFQGGDMSPQFRVLILFDD